MLWVNGQSMVGSAAVLWSLVLPISKTSSYIRHGVQSLVSILYNALSSTPQISALQVKEKLERGLEMPINEDI